MQALFTLDLEDHLARYDQTSRYPAVTRRIMSVLAESDVRGTVFVVAKIAESEPGLLREISDLGHEIACHSLDHIPLDKQPRDVLRTNTARAKHILEDCVGREVSGFRAPIFSLVEKTVWFADDLMDMGFRYSSSVMPTHNPLYGFPGAPQTPFKWRSGLVELPCPVGKIGPATLPYLGGFYLRYMPNPIIGTLMRRAGSESCLWTYCHPYDFDANEPFAKISGAAMWTSVLLWFNRRNTMKKVLSVMPNQGGITLETWVHKFHESLPTFEFDPQEQKEAASRSPKLQVS